MSDRPCYLYHICRICDKYDFSKGYIGVSSKPSKRWASGGYKTNPHLMNAIKKYDDIVRYVITFGTERRCLLMEARLRPENNIGWNIATGGGKPPSPKGMPWCISKLPQEKRRKVYIVSEETKARLKLSNGARAESSRQRMLTSNPASGKVGADRIGWRGWYVTPDGRFCDRKTVADFYGISLMTVTRRCVTGGLIGKNRHTRREWVGKTWKELGWYFEEE